MMKHRYDCHEALGRVAPRWGVIWLLFAMNTAALAALLRWPELAKAVAAAATSRSWWHEPQNGIMLAMGILLALTLLVFEFYAKTRVTWTLCRDLATVPEPVDLLYSMIFSGTTTLRLVVAVSPLALFCLPRLRTDAHPTAILDPLCGVGFAALIYLSLSSLIISMTFNTSQVRYLPRPLDEEQRERVLPWARVFIVGLICFASLEHHSPPDWPVPTFVCYISGVPLLLQWRRVRSRL